MAFTEDEVQFLGDIVQRAGAFRENPELWAAIRFSAQQTVIHHLASSPPMRKSMKDRAGFLIGWRALQIFYATPDALTASVLKSYAVDNNLCSRGRAAAVIDYMLRHGLLEAAPSGGRSPIIRPSRELEMYQRQETISGSEAIDRLIPSNGERTARLADDPALFRAYAAIHGRYGNAMVIAFGQSQSKIRLFTDRDSGWIIALDILSRSLQSPPTDAVVMSPTEIASRYDVSRRHAYNLVKDASTAGYMQWQAGSADVSLTPLMLDYLALTLCGVLAIQAAALARAGAAFAAIAG